MSTAANNSTAMITYVQIISYSFIIYDFVIPHQEYLSSFLYHILVIRGTEGVGLRRCQESQLPQRHQVVLTESMLVFVLEEQHQLTERNGK